MYIQGRDGGRERWQQRQRQKQKALPQLMTPHSAGVLLPPAVQGEGPETLLRWQQGSGGPCAGPPQPVAAGPQLRTVCSVCRAGWAGITPGLETTQSAWHVALAGLFQTTLREHTHTCLLLQGPSSEQLSGAQTQEAYGVKKSETHQGRREGAPWGVPQDTEILPPWAHPYPFLLAHSLRA